MASPMTLPKIDVGKANGFLVKPDSGEQTPEGIYAIRQRETAEKLFATFIVTNGPDKASISDLANACDFEDEDDQITPLTPFTSYFGIPFSSDSANGSSTCSLVSSGSSCTQSLQSRSASFSHDSRRSSVTSYGSDFTVSHLPERSRRTSSLGWTHADSESRKPEVIIVDQNDEDISLNNSSCRVAATVYENIIKQLKQLHDSDLAQQCTPCWTQDLKSLAATSRGWNAVATRHLYETIHITEEVYRNETTEYYASVPTRLESLRMVLRARQDIAALVKTIRVSPQTRRLCRDAGVAETRRLAAAIGSLVIACPRLERLNGLYPLFEHDIDGLSYALSTRRMLKERIWRTSAARTRSFRQGGSFDTVIDNDEQDTQHESRMTAFVQQSIKWSQLETLVLYGQGDKSLDHSAFVSTFRNLPSLNHLAICRFGKFDFDDVTLSALPSLHSLRLQHVAGVTQRGLFQFAYSKAASSLTRLVLVDLNVTSLPILQALVSLPIIQRLSIQQGSTHWTENGGSVSYDNQVILRSDTLEYLHFDTPSPSLAHDHLAISLDNNTFSALRKIRCPSDHDGQIQSRCYPLPAPTRSKGLSAFRFGGLPRHAPSGSLAYARQQAELRAEAARQSGAIRVVVEEEGMVKQVNTFWGFFGNLTSNIQYELGSDIKGSELALTQIDDVVGRLGLSQVQTDMAQPCGHTIESPTHHHTSTINSFFG